MSRTGDAIIQAMEEGRWEPGESWEPDHCEGCSTEIDPGTFRCLDCTTTCDGCGRRNATRGFEGELCADCRGAAEPHECAGCLQCAGMTEADF